MTITLIISLLASYLLGAIPFGLLFGRAVGKDVRHEGSGNIGATNVNRVLGKKLGILTLLCDVAKGFFPVFLAYSFLHSTGSGSAEWIIALCGLATILGHMFSVYMGFKGGKGVATALGVFLFFSPLAILFAVLLFIVVVYFSGFVSAGSLAASAFIPLCLWMLGSTTPVLVVACIIAFLIWLKHGSNIQRLTRGGRKELESKGAKMTKSEWKELIESKELLGLGDSATLGEIKRSYRQRCKAYHPDIVGDDKAKGDMMRKLTRAYDVLLKYTKQFKIPLIPQNEEAFEAEDWWMDRFGRDPLWGKK